MRNDKISVIVPAYNIESYVEKAVESICVQTYRNLEIILVNDGSSDSTPELLDKLAKKDNRIKVINKENGGVTRARLCGVEAATGEWIGFVDGDDYIDSQMYEMLLVNAKNYKADISHCGYQMVFPSRVDMYYGTGRLVEQDTKTGLKDLLEGYFVEPGLWNKLFNKKVFKSLLCDSKMDFSIKNNEDLLMNYYLFSASKKSIFEDQCPYYYMVRRGSATTSEVNQNKLQDPLKVLRVLEKETAYDQELQIIAKKRILAQLIRLSTLEVGNQREMIVQCRTKARKELRMMIPEVMKGDFSTKQKIMCISAAYMSNAYKLIHKCYQKITGLDKKYEVS